ncbi:hypothetical protein [Cellvibrio sp. NN19]|uniref:hypothetical protein n=1 Tax=Cellvibrio chitinivorans TaxID=3102792 RepID=UPI002B403353|nr:hypothetical protein [Cellvibrio sp. NN19]
MPGISKWEEFAVKKRRCPRYPQNFVEMAENVSKITEVIRGGIKNGAGNSGFVGLSLHLAPILATRCGKLMKMVVKIFQFRQKQGN